MRPKGVTLFFQLIEEETDTIFELENAVIRYDEETDSLYHLSNDDEKDEFYATIESSRVIDKHIRLKDVYCDESGGRWSEKLGVISGVRFKKSIKITGSSKCSFFKCTFDDDFTADLSDKSNTHLSPTKTKYLGIMLLRCEFFGITFNSISDVTKLRVQLAIRYNKFHLVSDFWRSMAVFSASKRGDIVFTNNKVLGIGTVLFNCSEFREVDLSNNTFESSVLDVYFGEVSASKQKWLSLNSSGLRFRENEFNHYVHMGIDVLHRQYDISWPQFKNKLLEADNIMEYYDAAEDTGIVEEDTFEEELLILRPSFMDSGRFQFPDFYHSEVAKRTLFLDYYKSTGNKEYSNAVFIEIKDMETKRLAYLYRQNPTFNTFFRWQINRFLKIFSAYGTDPARSVVFSMYVIFIFAGFYFFFPNSWDAQGKHRVMNRYTFFMKYLSRKAGMHELYLEDKKPDLAAYEEFKQFVKESGNAVPAFFRVTALPLNKWSMSGTRTVSYLLSKVDVLGGTWQEVPTNRRWWKMLLVLSAFLIALFFDLIIKSLNALTLSVNTFTTLGFGEIPIVGLPRYLAIVQGFIGWFMLSIFSVSLISQLLQ